MRYDEIRPLIASSSPDDWHMLGRGPLYAESLEQVSGGSASHPWVELGYHDAMWVYKPDVDLRIASGLTIDDRLNFGWHFPDPAVTRDLVDVFWQGSLVDRWTVLSVDGGRHLLPEVDRLWVKTGETMQDYQHISWTATQQDLELTRLVAVLSGHRADDVDTAVEQAGIVIVPS